MKKILYVGSEAMPFVSTGGLADVLGSLPKEIAKKEGYDVRVVIPLYGAIKDEYRVKMEKVCEFYINLAWRSEYCGVFELKQDNVTYYFIDNEKYFKRQGLYGHFDDGERFAFFSLAVMEMLPRLDFYPDIMNANDWQTALTVIYAKRKYGLVEGFSGIKTVFTIHNIEYQGKYGFDILGDIFALAPSDADIVAYDGCVNLMKGAIQCCDILTTVSPRYAMEIRTPEYSHDLHHIIESNSYKLHGILNGIDYRLYDPKNDDLIDVKYTPASPKKKEENKLAFQKAMALPEDRDIPMYAMITRLVSHKGLDLFCAIARRMLEDNIQIVILGTGDSHYESFLRRLEDDYHDKVRSIILYDRALSKKIYASSDFFIMPSKSEPCGLSQMIASRYGSVPITRETGGLADSIHGYWEEDGKLMGNGFTFYNYSSDELYDRYKASLHLYGDRVKYRKFVSKVMKEDFSWESSAEKYLEIYGLN